MHVKKVSGQFHILLKSTFKLRTIEEHLSSSALAFLSETALSSCPHRFCHCLPLCHHSDRWSIFPSVCTSTRYSHTVSDYMREEPQTPSENKRLIV